MGRVTDKRIGVLMGGVSAEREVSKRSGAAVLNALRRLDYNVVAVDVGPDICEVLRKEEIAVAFLTLHGGYGEDGSIQGLLRVKGVPFTGSGVLASALAMDKEMSKKVFLYHGIPVPPFVILGQKEAAGQVSGVNFDLPWIVKPATEGSSIGVTIVKERSSLNSAIDKAFSFGERIMLEKHIRGQEIHVGILNERVLGSVEVRPTVDFYSYEAKYTAGMTEYIIPPEIPPDVLRNAEKTALLAHMALGCAGAARVDLIVDQKGNPFVLEVNTIPGMTETSLLPKIAGLAGLDFPSLVEEILKGAITRREGT